MRNKERQAKEKRKNRDSECGDFVPQDISCSDLKFGVYSEFLTRTRGVASLLAVAGQDCSR